LFSLNKILIFQDDKNGMLFMKSLSSARKNHA
jgi:hypothetical protein